MSRRTALRPVLQSTQKLDYHVDDNVDKIADISTFLIKAGKARLDRIKQQVEIASTSSSPQIPVYNVAVGLRQTLKLLNRKELKWVVLDADVVKPSAVANVFGLLATSSTNAVKFYVIKDLSSTLGKSLNLPRASAVGFGPDCQLESIFDDCKPIEIVSKAKQPQSSLAAPVFTIPALKIPAGKYTQGLSKKQQKKLAKNKKK